METCNCAVCGENSGWWPWVAVVWIVGPMMYLGGGRYPLYADCMVALALVAFVLWASMDVMGRIRIRHEDRLNPGAVETAARERDEADRADEVEWMGESFIWEPGDLDESKSSRHKGR